MRRANLLSLFLTAVAAVPSPRSGYVLHEKRAFELDDDWVLSRRLDADQILPLRIGLAQSNLDKLEDMLMAVSHPTSSEYGNHWTPEQVIETFAPSSVSVETVKDWLINSGIAEERIKLSTSKGWMDVVNSTAAEVEDLLNTEYHVYTHVETGVEQISKCLCLQPNGVVHLHSPGCHSYYLPHHVKDHVELIKPTVHFRRSVPTTSGPRHKRQTGTKPVVHSHLRKPESFSPEVTITPSLENCDQTITLDCLRALYSVNYTPVATDRNTYGIGSSKSSPSDLVCVDIPKFPSGIYSSCLPSRGSR